MAPPSGPYNIGLPEDQLLTAQDGNNVIGSPVNILPPTGNPGEQDWHLQNEGDSITLMNLRAPIFAGFEGEPEEGSRIVLVRGPCRFYTEAGDDRQHHYIYAERDGQRLYLNVSPVRIFPPQLALSSRREAPWKFQFLE
ncbi:unnamed protein product [Rhizoctonia solani]|uniref:Uncharacterized protein n=1 Tax=Rhizoctonia solani TaxID=456999 RepID=A0A8H3C449_9AGAM|nr:unnamed protein product [Rhizoctonia solani]